MGIRKMSKVDELKSKNCTDCRHFGMCWLRRHKDNDEPCEDFEVEEWEKDDAE